MSMTESKHRSEQTISGSWQLDPQCSSVGMIPPRSKLIVKAHLVADTARAA
jgi:hypothetical protein